MAAPERGVAANWFVMSLRGHLESPGGCGPGVWHLSGASVCSQRAPARIASNGFWVTLLASLLNSQETAAVCKRPLAGIVDRVPPVFWTYGMPDHVPFGALLIESARIDC